MSEFLPPLHAAAGLFDGGATSTFLLGASGFCRDFKIPRSRPTAPTVDIGRYFRETPCLCCPLKSGRSMGSDSAFPVSLTDFARIFITKSCLRAMFLEKTPPFPAQWPIGSFYELAVAQGWRRRLRFMPRRRKQ